MPDHAFHKTVTFQPEVTGEQLAALVQAVIAGSAAGRRLVFRTERRNHSLHLLGQTSVAEAHNLRLQPVSGAPGFGLELRYAKIEVSTHPWGDANLSPYDQYRQEVERFAAGLLEAHKRAQRNGFPAMPELTNR